MGFRGRFSLSLLIFSVALAASMAGSAAAQTQICAQNPLQNSGCPAGKAEVTDDATATAQVSLLTTSIANVDCHAHFRLQFASATGTPVIMQIQMFLFDDCETSSGTACTVSSINLPYSGSLSGKTITVTDPVGAGFQAVCGFLINCTFTAKQFGLNVSNGSPATITASKVILARSGGFCPSTAEWHATYSVTSPAGWEVR